MGREVALLSRTHDIFEKVALESAPTRSVVLSQGVVWGRRKSEHGRPRVEELLGHLGVWTSF